MTESNVYWFVSHGPEGQKLVLVKAPLETLAWELLMNGEGQSSLNQTKDTFTLDAVTSLAAETCILGICLGDQFGLSVEPNDECTDGR